MKLTNPFLFQFIGYEGYTEESKDGAEHSVEIYDFGHQAVFANSRSLANIPRSGTELMNEIRNRYLWAIGYQAEIGEFIEYEKHRETILDTRYRIKDKDDYVEFKEDDDRFEYHSPTLKYIVMKPVENGECILDNTRTVTDLYGGTFPSARISLELAVKMKWVEWRQYSTYSEKDYLLGPNLRKEFPKDRMPEPGDIPQETIGEFDAPNYEKVYYKTDENYLYLSMFVNWVFTDLDRSFDDAFGDHIVPHISKRPLYVYSNAGRSVITGDKVTDLLREVPKLLRRLNSVFSLQRRVDL